MFKTILQTRQWMARPPLSLRNLFLATCLAGAAVHPTGSSAEPQLQAGVTGQLELLIALDATGISDWRFLSPRNPPALGDAEIVVFENQSVDRSFVVSVEVPLATGRRHYSEPQATGLSPWMRGMPAPPTPPAQETPEFLTFDNFKLTCDDSANACTFTAAVGPAGSARLRAGDLKPHGADGKPAKPNRLIRLTVRFFDEVDAPSNATGYLYPAKEVSENGKYPEVESKTRWRFAAAVGYTTDPAPRRNEEGGEIPWDVDDPFRGERRSRVTGSGRIDLTANLGSRADVMAKFGFKSGDLGEVDQTREVEATEYTVNIYGLEGWNLRFGRYTLAQPSSALAIRLKGEGLEVFPHRNLALGYLQRRESETGVADADDLDNEIFAARFQVPLSPGLRGLDPESRPIPDRRLILENIDLQGLWGREESSAEEVGGPYRHWTLGGEARFRFISRGVQDCFQSVNDGGVSPCFAWTTKGTLAAYSSERAAGAGATVVDGEGGVVLATLTFSRLKLARDKTELQRALQILAGGGSGDDPETANLDEGYIGETAAFAPDKLFLARLAAKTDPGDAGQIGASLANKRYGGLVYTDSAKKFCLLYWLAAGLDRILATKLTDDVASTKLVVRYHRYWFAEDVLGRDDAGQEGSIEFEMQSPKDISYSLGYARFDAGSALETILDDAWSVFGSVSLTI